MDARVAAGTGAPRPTSTLAFDPPMRSLAVSPERFDFAWRQLQYAFAFPDPRTAHRASGALSTHDHAIVHRFVSKARSLASSPFLGHSTSITVQGPDHSGARPESVETRFPHEESERGFLTLLRQFTHANEVASFHAVQRIVVRDDAGHGEPNAAHLRGWGGHHRKLIQHPPEVWAYRKWRPNAADNEIPGATGPHVEDLLKIYLYGDTVHFGDRRDDLHGLSADAFNNAFSRMRLYRGAAGLAHFYMGYAQLLDAIYAVDTTSPTNDPPAN